MGMRNRSSKFQQMLTRTRHHVNTLLGQGATEYLVLLAVVLIIALVSIALLGFFPGASSDTKIAQSKAYWSGQAYPVRILEVTIAPIYSNVSYTCGQLWRPGYRMAVQNTLTETITLEDVCFPGNDAECSNASAQLICENDQYVLPFPVRLGPGEKKTINVLDYSVPFQGIICDKAQTTLVEKNNIKLVYITQYGTRLVQVGGAPLIFRCDYEEL